MLIRVILYVFTGLTMEEESLASGYYWQFIAPDRYVLKYSALPGRYSPPVYDQSLRWYHMKLPARVKSVGSLDLKRRMREFRLVYVYFRDDLDVLEIWSRDLEGSIVRLTTFFSTLCKNSIYSESKE